MIQLDRKRRLKIAQKPIFSGLKFFLTSVKSQTREPRLKVQKQINRPQPGWNPRTLDVEASTLPGDHRGRLTILRLKINILLT